MSKVRRRFNEKYFAFLSYIFPDFCSDTFILCMSFPDFTSLIEISIPHAQLFLYWTKIRKIIRTAPLFSFWRILKTSIFVSYVGGGICSWFSQSESVIDIHHNQNLVRSGGKVVFLLLWKWVLRCFTPESKFAILLQSKSYEKFMNGIIHTSPSSSFKSLDILLFRKNEIGAHPLFS